VGSQPAGGRGEVALVGVRVEPRAAGVVDADVQAAERCALMEARELPAQDVGDDGAVGCVVDEGLPHRPREPVRPRALRRGDRVAEGDDHGRRAVSIRL
jgi:hypothetical protein